MRPHTVQYPDDSIRSHVLDLQALLDDPGTGRYDTPVVRSKIMTQILGRARRFGGTTATILMTGESGTGKEVVAKWIHQTSPRAAEPYVRINCAALPAPLIESELFGHERGAFTGAVQSRVGKLAAAGAGTVLLDEISEMDPGLQAKLLRILEEEEFQPVGSNSNQLLRARFIATSNRHLEQEVRDGRFREDLFYRLNVLRLELPPLRERRSDIRPLVEFFIAKYRNEASTPVRGIERDALSSLLRHAWPGNIRQLRNVVHRACVVNETGILQRCDFESFEPEIHLMRSSPTTEESLSLDEIERRAIVHALARHNGVKSSAAHELGICPRTLRNKLKRFDDPDSRGAA